MRNTTELVSIEIAHLAKIKKFNEICDDAYCFDSTKQAYYLNHDESYFQNNKIFEKHHAAPTREQLHKWLRDQYIYITIEVDQTMEPKFSYTITKFDPREFEWVIGGDNKNQIWSDLYYTYEQALEEALKEALELL